MHQCMLRPMLLSIACGIFVVRSAHQLWAVELIENGTFEVLETGERLDVGWTDGAGVANDLGLGHLDYPFFENGVLQGGIVNIMELPMGATDPSFTGTISPDGAGRWFGFKWGAENGDGVRGSATQIIDVVPYAGMPYDFSAWLSSPVNDEVDYALVTLEFFDQSGGNGTSLSTAVLDGSDQLSSTIVGSLNLNGIADPAIVATQDNWTLYRAHGVIPPTAESATVVIRGATLGDIGGRDGYVDLVSLQVVPEPASVVLVGILITVFAIQRRRLRRAVSDEAA